ncbi:IpaC/SipC family type III secretion system effector [Serratia proteamaculans]|uniref:IpaC/SipC family type III secretion system effector n=1 Tax=Serratia proteamaculans TaxID=28151 RepID=UPI001075E4F5|nr:IpaC/SipC family type III secretion system effector [Serratia proteamaculans]TFZ48676.1 IpaC/SipC family type III secretion system effector [Serratia proteamaculans]
MSTVGTAFNTAALNKGILTSEKLEPKALAESVSVSIADIKLSGALLSGELAGLAPALTPSRNAGNPAVSAFWSEKIENPESVRELNALAQEVEAGVDKTLRGKYEEQFEQGKPFDISGLTPSSIGLLIELNKLLLVLNISTTKLSADLSVRSAEAMKKVAGAITSEGFNNFMATVGQSAITLGLTVGGAGLQFKSFNLQKGALNNNQVKINSLNENKLSLNKALNGSKTVHMNGANGELSALGASSGRNVPVQPSNGRLSAEHKNSLSEHEIDITTKINAQEIARQNTLIQAGKLNAAGTSMTTLALTTAGAVNAGMLIKSAGERAEQQLQQVDSRAADETSKADSKVAGDILELRQMMQRLMAEIQQSKSSAMGAITGNIRA